MNYFRKIVLLYLFITFGCSVSAQITSGKIVYERKTNLYKKLKGDWVKQFVKEENKSKIDYFELFFNDTISLFMPQESELADNMSWTTSKNTTLHSYRKNYRLTVKPIWGEDFFIEDTLRERHWKITDNKRKISGYECRKAIWQANDSTRIYAWYCDEIVPSIGPESFYGLPGAIMGLASEDGGVIYFAKSVTVQKPDILALIPQKGKKKLYTPDELKSLIQRRFGKYEWGKSLIKETFGEWY